MGENVLGLDSETCRKVNPTKHFYNLKFRKFVDPKALFCSKASIDGLFGFYNRETFGRDIKMKM